MPVRVGNCTNFGNCDKADNKEEIAIPDGGSEYCPSCESRLTILTQASKPDWTKFVLPAVGFLALAGIFIFGFNSLKGCGSGSGTATNSGGGNNTGTVPPKDGDGTKVPDGKFEPIPPGYQTVLTLSGSNTINSKLGPNFVDAFLKEKGGTNIRLINTAENERAILADVPATEFDGASKVAIIIKAHGTKTGIADLYEGKTDIACASQSIMNIDSKKNWVQEYKAAGYGDLTSYENEHIIAKDGLAIFVHSSNPLSELTRSQIVDIYKGRITNWKQLGGSDKPIVTYGRDDKSGTREAFTHLAMRGDKDYKPQNPFEDSGQLVKGVENDPNAIGFVSMAYLKDDSAIKKLRVGDSPNTMREPTVSSVKSGDYVLSRPLYMYVRKDRKPLADKLIKFAESDKGQPQASISGFVDKMVVDPTEVASGKSYFDALPTSSGFTSDAPQDYRQLVNGAKKLGYSIRFKSNSPDLDNESLGDKNRIVQWFSNASKDIGEVYVIGFADSIGTDKSNLTLSKIRAVSVADSLRKSGIRSTVVTGYGERCRIVENERSPDDFAKNRRVEIWVRGK